MTFFIPTSGPNPFGGSTGVASEINSALQTTLNQQAGFVNAFRNGSFLIAQRGTSGSTPNPTSAYMLDGWTGSAAGTGNPAWSQDTSTLAPYTGLTFNCASGTSQLTLTQNIAAETMQGAQYAGSAAISPMTAQYLIVNNSGSSITLQIRAYYMSSVNNFATQVSDLVATNLQTVGAGATAVVAYAWTPNANCVKGYRVDLLFGGGLNHGSGSVSVFAADFRATPQATTGLVALPPTPELRGLEDEMARNLPFYFDPANGGTTAAFETPTLYSPGSSTTLKAMIPTPPMRTASPTITTRNASYTNGSALSVSALSTAGVLAQITGTASGLASAAFNMTLSCEL